MRLIVSLTHSVRRGSNGDEAAGAGASVQPPTELVDAGDADRRATVAPRVGLALHAWWLELAVLTVGYVLYQTLQIQVTGSERSAVSRADWLWGAEQSLHIDPELWLDHLVAANRVLVLVTGFYYGILHFTVAPLVLVWLRLRRAEVYSVLRTTLVVASAVALVGYWLLPMAPPRLAVPGIVDTLKVNDILSAASPTGPAALANQYAAMPSLHVAWAVWVALALVVAFQDSRLRHLAWAYPAVTTMVVVGTGNHFVTDTAAGALVVWISWWVTTRVRLHLSVGAVAADGRVRSQETAVHTHARAAPFAVGLSGAAAARPPRSSSSDSRTWRPRRRAG